MSRIFFSYATPESCAASRWFYEHFGGKPVTFRDQLPKHYQDIPLNVHTTTNAAPTAK